MDVVHPARTPRSPARPQACLNPMNIGVLPMNAPSSNPLEGEDDQQKAHTPDKLRNDDARWKDKDMPEQEHTATPDDYERPPRP